MSAKINLQKKLSVTRLVGKMTIKRVLEHPEQKVPCGRFYGTASGTKTGITDFGEWTALTGQFRAVHPETGEISDSGVCFLPDVALEMVTGQLAAGAVGVDFAFDLVAVPDDASTSGFGYRAIPVFEMAEDNPIMRMEAKMQALLPAPAAAPASEKKVGKK